MSKAFSGLASANKTLSGVACGGSGGSAINIDGGAAGEVLFQDGVSSTTFTNAADGVLQSDAITPYFAALSLSGSRVTGTLPLTKGGTGSSTLTGITGTGRIVADNTPTLITPIIGAATATSITGSAAVDLDFSQPTSAKRIKLSTLDTSIQMYKGATLVGEFNSTGAQFPESVTITGAATLFAGNNQLDGSGQGQYQNYCTDNNTAYYAQTASGKYINSQYSDATNTVAVGQNATGHAEISTATAKDFIVKPNSTEQFRVKSGGVVQVPGYISKRALATDGSGNIAEPTINGTGNLVATTGATGLSFTAPDIGTATGTSLNLSGLTATSPVVTDGSKNLTSASITGTAGSAVVLQNTPTLTTPNIGAATGTSLTCASGANNTVISTSTIYAENASGYVTITGSQAGYYNDDCTAAFYTQSNPGAAGSTFYTDTNTSTNVGQNAAGHAEIYTTSAKDFIVKPNNTEQFRVKSGGVVQMSGYASKRALATDGSGNIAEPTINGTGNLVATTGATGLSFTAPDIGTATGTSLNLSGLTATSPVVTDGSKNLTSASITGTAGSAVVLQNTPTLTTPNIGVAQGTSLTTGDSLYNTSGLTKTSTFSSISLADNTPATSYGFINLATTAGESFFIGKGNTALPSGGSASDGRGVLWLTGNFPMDFYTNNTARVTFQNDGYVRYRLAAYQNKLVWHDSTGIAQPIALGASGTRLIGNGTTSAPTFAAITTPSQRVFTSGTDATYTPTSGCIYFIVEVIGGGGGAGGGNQNGANGKAGGGGGGGAYVRHTYPASGTYTYTIVAQPGSAGAGGAGVATSGDANDGTAGGSTLWKVSGTTKLTAAGGSAGLKATTGGVDGNGGVGGIPTSTETGSFLANGGDGGYGKDKNGGAGGSSRMAGVRLGGAGVATLSNGPTATTPSYGQGGGGGVYGGNGGGGVAGVVLITEYF